MYDVIYKKFNWALFWPIWWSHLHYIVDFFQMYIILMSWMNSSWVFWKLSECKRPTWRQTLLRFSLKNFCLQDQWWSCKCWNFCAISMRLTSKPIGLCVLVGKHIIFLYGRTRLCIFTLINCTLWWNTLYQIRRNFFGSLWIWMV